ncbi:hypothetical protein YC2023_067249 [Brassica napus]
MTPLTPRYPTMMHVFISCLSRLAHVLINSGERFGPRLPLPFSFAYGGYVSLSSVKEERLAMLLKQPGRIFEIIDVWVTDKIEPGAVSWSKLFKEKKNFVVFDNCEGSFKTYIIDGESGHFREVESIEAPYSRLDNLVDCYVPSSVQI